MKKIICCLVCLMLINQSKAQEHSYDSTALLILDHMSAIIGDLSSCSFTIDASNDIADKDLGTITGFEKSDIFFSGPDKMMMNISGDKGHKGYWYNGQLLWYYSYTENNYAVIDAPGNTIATIDSVNENYGIEFPAADFFYPSFTDDLLSSSDNISYQGISIIDDKPCFHITAKNKEMNIQFWITNDAMFRPVKMLIVYNNKNKNTRYEASFSNWQLNPEIPPSMFKFVPPPGAHQVSIRSKNGN